MARMVALYNTGVYLVGGVMVGLVQSVIELAWNWCSKEVPAE